MDEITSVFVTESREQLQAMEEALLELEKAPDDADTLNAVFRAAHTIKGGAGVVECDFLVSFTHVVESVLDKLRNGEIRANDDLTALLLACSDHMGNLIGVLERGEHAPDDALRVDGDALLGRLQNDWLDAGAQTDGERNARSPSPADAAVEISGGGEVETDCWHISLRFGPDVLRNGMDPLSFLRFLTSLGRIAEIHTVTDGMPPAEEMDPESCYLGFEISFASDASKSDIEKVFDFVRDDCALNILPPRSKLSEYVALMLALPEDTMRLGEILVKIGALTPNELEQGLGVQALRSEPREDSNSEPAGAGRLGEILVEQHVVQPELVEAAVSRQKLVSDKKATESRLIRIQADKLDRLIDLVGELVISNSGVSLLANRSGIGELIEAASLSNRLVEDIRDSALQLRMVQIGETFNRFNRVVRDVSRELGKDIELVISGGETELDKSMVEKIGDPLMHLVRNAIDHGIEPPEKRRAAGKPERGRVELNAVHDSGSIVIEVVDDGGGLDRDKLLAKAIERGVVQAGQTLSDHEVFNLIFEAGFSTAEQVSNLSGRGVGMDVVRRNIQSLRGSVEISSELGRGSRFAIRLPLTLAIIDGFLVQIGSASYVIPLDMVVECIELTNKARDNDYLNLRGEVLPFVRLRELFEVEGPAPMRQNVVVVHYAGLKAGIVVDQLLGEFQTVIKPLGSIFKHVKGIAGSTILGSGEVALIIDVQALVERRGEREGNLLRDASQARKALPTRKDEH